MKPAIITTHVYPPIPQRYFDWCAYRDGYEPGCLVGWGSTEAIAIADLEEKELEAAHMILDEAAYAQWCEEESRRDDAREGFDG